ncbi:MAG: PEP-CTERM sorting domain-containing protein [Planctomycetes bacterium]|nr:PEP-CTERM sorting domain-containing protein [Planctomycetota bacterium]
MKTKLFILLLFVMSTAVWATDYEVTWGDDFGGLDLIGTEENPDTLLMTGGTGHDLNASAWSTAIIHDTDPMNIPETAGGIWEVTTTSYSELTINGGEFYELGLHGESIANLYGGQIFGSLTVNNSTAWVHIYGYGFNNDPFTGSPLTGFWADDTAFSINLVDDGISTYDQIVFHEIPEPVSIILFGLGGILVRKCKQ